MLLCVPQLVTFCVCLFIAAGQVVHSVSEFCFFLLQTPPAAKNNNIKAVGLNQNSVVSQWAENYYKVLYIRVSNDTFQSYTYCEIAKKSNT